jgi:uncharacterized membrane protein
MILLYNIYNIYIYENIALLWDEKRKRTYARVCENWTQQLDWGGGWWQAMEEIIFGVVAEWRRRYLDVDGVDVDIVAVAVELVDDDIVVVDDDDDDDDTDVGVVVDIVVDEVVHTMLDVAIAVALLLLLLLARRRRCC